MARARRNYKVIRALAYKAWREGEHDLEKLANSFHLGVRTLEKWRREDDWQGAEVTIVELQAKAERLILEAECVALEDYINDPENKEKQSLINLIKHHKEQFAPSKELNQYVIKFMQGVVDFAIENGLEVLREQFQEHGREIADHLRVSNNG
ncbi:MAG: hypothetical protein M0Q16_07940 [Candidatus Cloacimonetes bacterium]|jgi:uncharacterized protein YjcR|nr:hypothetical protein [Candidatus Cloacimonadota bacterium]MCK9185289.1 hypothetical protein [Candidatus Cloacimonadota bacterium]